MFIAGRYIKLPSKSILLGIGASVLLLIGVIIPLSLVNKQTDTRIRAEVNAAFTSSVEGVPVNGPALSLPANVKILVDSTEPMPVQKAALDLQRDMGKVLGQQPVIVNTIADLNGASAVVVSYQGSETTSFRDTTLTGEESHQFAVRTVGGINYVVLQGTDPRGTAYAVYTFADKIVGIPPLWFWSELQPEVKSTLQIGTNGGVRITTPQVKYRTWFLNNQDLFLSWTPTSNKYDMVLETMMRLKFNTYYVGPSIGEYKESVYTERTKPAQERGMIIATNALSTFGSWDGYWQDVRGMTPPALTLANQAKYEDLWRHSLQYAKDKGMDVLWIIGFRGRGDGGFWGDISDAPTTEAARGDVIEAQTVRQAALIRSVMGDQHPKMAFLLWNELSNLTDNGKLQLPKDPDIIWAFGNDIRDHFPTKSSRTYTIPTSQPVGFYMNLQFYSTGAHLAEAEGPWKAWKNFSIIASRKSDGRVDMGMLNVGNMREFLITTNSAADMMWNIGSYNVDTGLRNIFGRYFGSVIAPSLVTTYKSMIYSYWQQKPSDIAGFERQYVFQDLRIKEAAKVQLSKIQAKTRNLNPFNNDRLRIDNTYNKAASQVGSVMLGSQKAYKSFESVVNTIDGYTAQIPLDKRAFYKDVFRVPATYLASTYKTLYLITRSHFKVSSSISEATCYLKDAKVEAAKIQPALNEAKHGQFTSWYNGEDLFGVQDLMTRIDTSLAALPQTTCVTASDVVTPTPTPTRTPTPTVAQGVTPTPTRTPTPTLTPTPVQSNQFTQSAHTSTSGLKQSNVKDGKRTVFRAMRSMTLKQVACYGCGSGSTFILRNSSSSYKLGSQIISTSVQGVSSSWGFANVNIPLIGGHYYILEFKPAVFPAYYGGTEMNYSDIKFVRFATVGAPTWKTGSWQIRLIYQK